MYSRSPLALAVLALFSLAGIACASSGTTSTPDAATVRFQLVAPLCSSVFPATFSIDGRVVATDTFFIHTSHADHTTRDVTTTAGHHLIAAGFATATGSNAWPDRTVTLAPGDVFVDTLATYCS